MASFGNIVPHDYQEDARDCVFHHFDQGGRRALLQLPTGTGKTVVMGMCAHEAISRRWPVLLLAHRRDLISQARGDFEGLGLDTALEMGGSRAQKDMAIFGSAGTLRTVVIGSIATMKGDRLKEWPQERFGLILVDETHHVVSKQYRDLLDHFQNYCLIGVTATADRADGKNLGIVFNESDRPVYEFPLKTAIELEYLSRIEVCRLFTGININKVKKTTSGDLNLEDLAELITPEINLICKHILREVEGRKTIVFAPNVKTSQAFASCLSSKGYSARSVDNKDSDEYRKETIRLYHEGHLQFLCNYGLFTEGFNAPSIEAVVMARATTSRALYSQMVGRGTRKFPGKDKCLLVDLVFNSDIHDLVHPVELFDNSNFDAEVEALARKVIDSGTTRDLVDAINQADRQHRENKKLRVQHREVQFQEYHRVVYDPMGMCDLGLVKYRKSDFIASSSPNAFRPTAKQVEELTKFKIEHPETLTRSGAQARLNVLYDRRRRGLASYAQLQHLVANGTPEEQANRMTVRQASEQLSMIFAK